MMVPAWARPVVYNLSDTHSKKQIRFESQAPAEYIEGVAEGLMGTVTIDTDQPLLGLNALISVPVNQMQTGNSSRDEHLRSAEWLNAPVNPSIRFDLSSTDEKSVVKKGEGHWFVKASGTFFLKGISKPLSVPVTLKLEKDRLHVEGRFTVHLEDFGIRGPSQIKMIGLKVSPDVQVVFHLVGVPDKGWSTSNKKKKY